MADDTSSLDAVELATELTIAWLGNPNTRVSSDEVPAFLNSMHAAVRRLSSESTVGESGTSGQTDHTPAVSARRSLASKDHIISMIDGKPYKTLRRHLTRHGLTPDQYRQRYGLKADYPMVAPSYSEVRRSMARKIGLGKKRQGTEKGSGSEPKSAARSRSRKGGTTKKQTEKGQVISGQ